MENNELTIKQLLESDELKEKVGSSVDYYKNAFNEITGENAKLSVETANLDKILLQKKWNVAGLIFGVFWAIWRGVPYAWYLIGLTSLSIVLSFIPIVGQLTSILGLSSSVIYGMYGNSFYLIKLVRSRNDSIDSVKPSIARLIGAVSIFVVSLALVI
jgi:hypothetical protein